MNWSILFIPIQDRVSQVRLVSRMGHLPCRFATWEMTCGIDGLGFGAITSTTLVIKIVDRARSFLEGIRPNACIEAPRF